MKISIVTPSFNQGRFINKAIDSVRAQKGVAIEHLIFDNCSDDGTRGLLERYQAAPGGNEVYVAIEPDEGQTAAINKGFLLSTGDIVCWLNTDEWYLNQALATIVDYFRKNEDVDIVFGDCDFVDVNGRLIRKKREHFFSSSMLLYYGCFLPSCATFVRRRALSKAGILDEDFRVTMDFEWYVRLARAGCRFLHVPETLAAFTWHEANISSTLVERRLFERRLVQDRYSRIQGPKWLRGMLYRVLRDFWIGIRVVRRALG